MFLMQSFLFLKSHAVLEITERNEKLPQKRKHCNPLQREKQFVAITWRSREEKKRRCLLCWEILLLSFPLFSQTSDIVSVNLLSALLLMKFNALPPTLSPRCIHCSLSCVSAALSAYRAIGITNTVVWTWEDWCFLTNTGRSPIKRHSGLAEAAANTALQSEDIICEDAACVWVERLPNPYGINTPDL